jgi:hypothetical protein
MPANIIFNGKPYESAEEMPTDIRAAYEAIMGIMADKNQNGVPDLMEGMPGIAVQAMQAMQIFFEGKMYSGVDQLPPEARARYEQAMARLDQNKDGVIDFLQASAGQPALASALPAAAVPLAQETTAPAVSPSAITEDRPDRRLIVAGVIIAVLLCAVVGLAALMYLR